MNIPRIVTNPALQLLASPGETHEVHVIIRRIANQAPYTLRGRNRQYIVSRDNARNAHILKVPLSVWMHGCDKAKPVAENSSISYDIQSSRTGLKAPLTFEVWPIAGKSVEAAQVDSQSKCEALLDIMETLILRLGYSINKASMKELLTPYLKDAENREANGPSINMFTDFDRNEIIEFINCMNWNPSPTSIPPQFRKLLDKLGAPEAVLQGLDFLEAGDIDGLEKFTDELTVDEPAAINIADPKPPVIPAPKPAETPKPQAAADAPRALTNSERQAAYRARKRAEKEAAEALKLQTV